MIRKALGIVAVVALISLTVCYFRWVDEQDRIRMQIWDQCVEELDRDYPNNWTMEMHKECYIEKSSTGG